MIRKLSRNSVFFLENKDNDDHFLPDLVFSDETMFHINSTVNQHNVRKWEIDHPYETVEHHRDYPKVILKCNFLGQMGLFFFL